MYGLLSESFIIALQLIIAPLFHLLIMCLAELMIGESPKKARADNACTGHIDRQMFPF
jgi:hypothetical protein